MRLSVLDFQYIKVFISEELVDFLLVGTGKVDPNVLSLVVVAE